MDKENKELTPKQIVERLDQYIAKREEERDNA